MVISRQEFFLTFNVNIFDAIVEIGEIGICHMDHIYSISTHYVFEVGVRVQNMAENPCTMGVYILEGDREESVDNYRRVITGVRDKKRALDPDLEEQHSFPQNWHGTGLIKPG